MVLIMNVLKYKRIVRNRGRMKDVDYDMEGSIPEKGYDFETQDEAEGGEENLNKGLGGSSKKKKKSVCSLYLDKESDFMKDLVRDYKKKSESKGKRIKGITIVRVSSPSDDETLARRLERKRYPSRCQEKHLRYKGDLGDEDSEE